MNARRMQRSDAGAAVRVAVLVILSVAGSFAGFSAEPKPTRKDVAATKPRKPIRTLTK